MTFVLVGQDDKRSDAAAGSDSDVDFPPRSAVCRCYRPPSAVSAAAALGWVPYADALSSARSLLAASHEDLQLRAHQLSLTLSAAFFDRDFAAVPPVAAGGARFPEHGLYVCVDLPPFGPALQDVQRALMQVAVKNADHGSCDCYFDTVRHVMWLLVGDEGDDRVACGSVVFGRDKFESAFALEWVD